MVKRMLVIALTLVGAATAHAQWAVNGSNIHNTNAGNVGIGVVNPLKMLQVYAGNGDGIVIGKNVTSEESSANVYLYPSSGNSNSRNWVLSGYYDAVGDFAIRSSNVAGGDPYNAGATRLTITRDGDVGIGTTNPGKRLDVTGDIRATGTITGGLINAKFQDLAEWVEAREPLSAGTVVVVVPGNAVTPSEASYDTSVAGVVSAQPGIVLGEAGASKVMVATTGRVKVRATAANGAIREGDLLVSSEVRGFAMRSEPIMVQGRRFHQPGTVIGKALEPLATGTGEILVLLSLQ